MVYIKLEQDMDKFMAGSYEGFPKSIKKILFQSKCRNGKFQIEKFYHKDSIILPSVNDKTLKKLKHMATIKCWKNICVSDNLLQNPKFMQFVNNNAFHLADGKWLFKVMSDKVLEFVVSMKNEIMANQEISILCNQLDETILEKIKEICKKVKICNILTNNIKQFQKLEEEIYAINGIILNVSNNYKRALMKSNIVVNFDFDTKFLEKCSFSKNAYFIDLKRNLDFLGRSIIDFEISMPHNYIADKETLRGFSNKTLYESFIYKHTNYKNIQKELEEDNVKILYLKDSNGKIIKNPNLNLPKTLDKIVI